MWVKLRLGGVVTGSSSQKLTRDVDELEGLRPIAPTPRRTYKISSRRISSDPTKSRVPLGVFN